MTLRRILILLISVSWACEAAPPKDVGTPVDVEPTMPPVPGNPKSSYDPSSGLFVVHEWGTLTSVMGSDGKVQPGLHHEEEDLPGFVADRMAQADATPSIVQKMETPVTYFYAPAARRVAVKVSFPHGIFTQWFPYVQNTLPVLFGVGTGIVDPWISTSADGVPAQCRARYQQDFSNGLLDWGTVDVLPRQSSVGLPGPLGDTTWHFARNTAANPVQVQLPGHTYSEKFLFYRGLGNFPLPLEVRTHKGGGVTLANGGQQHALGHAFLINVAKEGAGFTSLGEIAAASQVEATLPAASLPLPEFVAKLKAALGGALVSDGLYDDEARAMVDTWERSYFLTPGPRVLYMLPQTQIEGVIPLQMQPRPDRVVRTMVVRVELLTPEAEADLSTSLAQLASPNGTERAGAHASFLARGRFAEPGLRRALSLTTSNAERTAGEALLGEISAKKRWSPLAAE